MPTLLRRMAALHALGARLVEGCAQVERVRDRVEHGLGGARRLRVGCRAAESWMLSAPISRAKASQSSIARSGSGSRTSRGVSSCRAAVSTPTFMNFGRKGSRAVNSISTVGTRGQRPRSCRNGIGARWRRTSRRARGGRTGCGLSDLDRRGRKDQPMVLGLRCGLGPHECRKFHGLGPGVPDLTGMSLDELLDAEVVYAPAAACRRCARPPRR